MPNLDSSTHKEPFAPKLLFVAFACEPGRGSEPGIGWNFVDEASRRYPVWVLTHSSFKKPLEAYLETQHQHHPIHPIYVRLPGLKWLWNFGLGINLYYYLWQFVAARVGRKAHRAERFELIQHVSFQRYWMHSAGASIGAPFIFGPVGGGEIWPPTLKSELTFGDRMRTYMWTFVRFMMEKDPLLRRTLRKAVAVIPSVDDATGHLQRLGIQPLPVMACVAPQPNLERFVSNDPKLPGFRFISIGRIPRWKGLHLGLKAFAKAFGPSSEQNAAPVEYTIVGQGSDLAYLKGLARELHIESKVHFVGDLNYSDGLSQLSKSHAMIHPTMRDSGGLVFESLMLGIPVACLNVGLPSMLVGSTGGIVIDVEKGADAIIEELSKAMIRWFVDYDEYVRLQAGAKVRVQVMSREKRGDQLDAIYRSLLSVDSAKTPVDALHGEQLQSRSDHL
jgi:glycosyltransferase involved in cell wall biosynthesis